MVTKQIRCHTYTYSCYTYVCICRYKCILWHEALNAAFNYIATTKTTHRKYYNNKNYKYKNKYNTKLTTMKAVIITGRPKCQKGINVYVCVCVCIMPTTIATTV